MKRILLPILCFVLLLSGCGWMQGSYASVVPYAQQDDLFDESVNSVSSYEELRSALVRMLENGEESRTLSLVGFNSYHVETNLKLAIQNVCNSTPIGAYAVDNILYDLGSTGGVSAVALTVQYNHNRSQIKNIRRVRDMTAAKSLITGALNAMEPDLVFMVEHYRSADFDQIVWDYALNYPELVMEQPSILENIYPESGSTRIVELKFIYENSRESLRSMQSYVGPRFASAAMFISGDEEPSVKYHRLYAFLMETSDYTLETSLTPTYSLLRHSVGDSRAFATVFAAMCRRSGLTCHVINGTREGEPWTWNMIASESGGYRHLDLVDCYLSGGYSLRSDEDMIGYVWDYAAYPQALTPPKPVEPTIPPEDPAETTSPTEPTEPTEPTDPTEPTEPEETTPPTETTIPEETQPYPTEGTIVEN